MEALGIIAFVAAIVAMAAALWWFNPSPPVRAKVPSTADDFERLLRKAVETHGATKGEDTGPTSEQLLSIAIENATDEPKIVKLSLSLEMPNSGIDSRSGQKVEVQARPCVVCFSSQAAVDELTAAGLLATIVLQTDQVRAFTAKQICNSAVRQKAAVLLIHSLESSVAIHNFRPPWRTRFAIAWRFVGLALGCLLEVFTTSELILVAWGPLRFIAFGAAGLVLGEIAERIWRGRLGTARIRFSLRTLLIMTVIGPPLLAWAYFEWQASRRTAPEPTLDVPTIEEILRNSGGSP